MATNAEWGANDVVKPAPTTNTADGRRAPGRARVVTLLVVGCAVMVLMMTMGGSPRPFDLDSSAPDGYRALGIVLEDDGIVTRSVTADDPVLEDAGEGMVVYVPQPRGATGEQLVRFTDAARRGAVVVYGSVPPSHDELDEDGTGSGSQSSDEDDHESDIGVVDPQTVVDQPVDLLSPGTCDIAELEELGPIDIFDSRWVSLPLPEGPAVPVGTEVIGTCYGSADSSQLVELAIGSGRIFVISSPYLWTNARLKATTADDQSAGPPGPSSEGRPYNDLTAWRILSSASPDAGSAIPGEAGRTEVLVVDSLGVGAGASGEGADLLTLLPTPFKAFAVMLVVAAAVFVWSRSVRLGAPVDERTPVTVEASELTAAIGRLFIDDPAFIDRGAEAIRRDARIGLASELGMDPDVEPGVLCQAVAKRSRRDANDVSDLLYGGTHMGTVGAVIDLDDRIERLRMEVGNGRSL